MRKPVVIGCLTVFVVLLAAGGFVAWKVGRPYFSAFLAARDLARIHELDSGIRNKADFAPPADGVLDEDQIERYFSASERVMNDLDVRMQELSVKYEQLDTDENDLSASELAAAWGEIISLLVTAKKAQVEALNTTGFSLGEYTWVKNQVIQASGHSAVQVDLAEAITGSGDGVTRQERLVVPAENSELVEPHTDRLDRIYPLAAFGL